MAWQKTKHDVTADKTKDWPTTSGVITCAQEVFVDHSLQVACP